MEVILVKPVKKLGKIGQLVKVKNGFGRNYLIPQNLAIRANEANKKLIEQKKHEYEEGNLKAKENAKLLANAISGKDITFIKQSADDGKLFGSVSNKEIAKELSVLSGQNILHSYVVLELPLKTLGVFNVEIALHPEVSTKILVTVARSESEAIEALRVYKLNTENQDQISA